MTRPFLLHLLFMLLGFALAALAAATIISLIALLPSSSSYPYYWSKVFSNGRQVPGTLLLATYAVAIYALPGWLISVVIAEIWKERRWQSFALAGVFTALVALYYANMERELSSLSILFFGILASGFFGGLVYWAVAGRRSGDWRQAPVQGAGKGGGADA
jgi:hypothetical protein